ncbi:molybdenum cofactor guanylyltransferase [Microbacterium aurantiacum]|uniref:molybdenum cofactor guanylyltransferase n=1 Tax=Microbacterium aurantiacum TaxID=162393 RepID=UPI001F31B6D7|nr:NTP transferase domain-containing protein [Microbacterium aurantiacum]
MSAGPRLGAIVLAGGRATRLDGAEKPLLDVGGRSLLARAADAAVAVGAADLTVVGPESPLDAVGTPVRWVREDPPFGGPAAAIVAALAATAAAEAPEWTLVLAGDLPHADEAARLLVADLDLFPADTDGVCLADASGRPQWLTGVYRTRALREAASALPDRGRDAAVRALLDDLAVAVLRAPAHVTDDVDTWEDLHRARRRFASAPSPSTAEEAPR